MRLDERFRWLIWLSLIEIGTMLVFSNYSALLPVLQKEWSLSNIEAGWIYSSYQIGYIAAVVFFTSLTDYTHPKSIYILTALWSGTAGLFFSLFADGFYSALILRTLMGIGFAGTYMPGLRMVSEKFPSEERGKAVGIYVAAFSLGVSLSIFLTGFIHSFLSWRWAFLLTSLGPIAGGAAAFFKLGAIQKPSPRAAETVPFLDILRNRPALQMIGGYVAHMWEMFGMRGWIVAFLTACLLTAGSDFQEAVGRSAFIAGIVMLVGAASNALGGALSDRFGRARTVTVVMLGSGLLSLLIGWTRTFPFWIVLVLAILYGFMVTGESSVLSTGVTETALPGGLGRTMAVQSLLGFGAASLSPILFGYILDITNPPDAMQRFGYVPNWGWAFVSLGIGGLVGPLIVLRGITKQRR
jgi:MFS family permease